MEKNAETPSTLPTAIDRICAAAPHNATVVKLHELDEHGIDRYASKIDDLKHILEKMHMHTFTSLVRSQRQANTAVVLYAGDGMVVKITTQKYLPEKYLPCQLPPMRRYYVDGLAVEVFPWIDTHTVNEKDVSRLREELKTYGFDFKEGDARVDNIGRLPNGQCAILDGDAIEFRLKDREMMDVNRWMRKMYEIFDPVYTAEPKNGEEIRLVTEHPDFNLRFSPLITPKSRIDTVSSSTEVASAPRGRIKEAFRVLFSANPKPENREARA